MSTSEVPFVVPAERQVYVEYDRDRRLRLSRIIAPVFAAILTVVLLASQLAPAHLQGTRSHIGLVGLCDLCFIAGAVGAWRRRVNGATGAILPAAFGRVNRRFRTPTLALGLAMVLTIGIAVWAVAVYGAPPNSFYVPVATALLLVVALLAQFFTAVVPDHFPGVAPQVLGLVIAGGWLVVGIVRMLVLRANNPAALEAGERIYVAEG